MSFNKKNRKSGQNSKSAQTYSWCVGRKPVVDLFNHKPDRIMRIFVLQSKHELSREFSSNSSIPVEVLTEDLFHTLFPEINELNHQGVCAKVHVSSGISISQLIKKSQKSGRGILIGLDQVKDPHNLGSIFRTAEVLGADGLFFTSDHSAQITPAVRRVSVSSTEFLPYSQVSNLSQSLDLLREEGFWIFGTSLSPESVDIETIEIPFPIVLLFGSEFSGLRSLTEKKCDRLVHIAQFGITESLNVACAVSAMLMYVRSKLPTSS